MSKATTATTELGWMIWSFERDDWYKPVGTNYRPTAIFREEAQAKQVAAGAHKFRTYAEAEAAGACEVRRVTVRVAAAKRTAAYPAA